MLPPDSEEFPRSLPLQGTPNFRDFGGYASTDGRRVKWGYLFRSGQLSTLSASDQNLLAELELDLVCDFRRLEEQERDPSLLPVPGPQVVSLPITPGSNASFFDEAESHWQTDAQTMFNFMVEINRDFALQQSESYACMFDMLVQTDDARVLVHCAAGKDRTGYAAAIILLALGVSREAVMQDYLLTAEYFKPDLEFRRMQAKYGMQVEASVLRPILEVHADYLQAAFDAIDAEFGSVEAYLGESLGMDGDKCELLRQRYLV